MPMVIYRIIKVCFWLRRRSKRAQRLAFVCKTYSKLGFETLPRDDMKPYDIVTSIKLGSEDKLIDFAAQFKRFRQLIAT